MHFGRVDDIKNLDLSLPPQGARTGRYLKLGHGGGGRIYCGAPIWACKDWQGSVYPERARPASYLRHYAESFSMIEFNGSFYRIPTPEQIHAWRQDVGPEFRFCPKLSKDLSHNLPKFDKDILKLNLRMLEGFGDNLGLSFMQLPEWFAVDQFPFLEAFLKQWSADFPLAVEFRHPSWFQDHMLRDPVINFLYKHKLATVITDTPGERHAVHSTLTYPAVLLRFMGLFPSQTDQQRLRTWLDRLEDWAHAGMDSIYIAIHQERNGSIPMTVDFVQRYLDEKKFEGTVRPNQKSSDSGHRGGDEDEDEDESEDLILGLH